MRALDARIGAALRAVPIACLMTLFALLFVNVVARTFQLAGFAWFDEAVQGLFAWMVFVGAAALWREADHFQVPWLPESLPLRGARALRLITTTLSLAFLGAMTWFGLSLTMRARASTPILDLPTALFHAAIPASGAFMMAHSVAHLIGLATPKDPRP